MTKMVDIIDVDVNMKLNVDATRELANNVFAACVKYDDNCSDNDSVAHASMAPMKQWAQDMLNICDKFKRDTVTKTQKSKGGKKPNAE